jgi:hypothetical protein
LSIPAFVEHFEFATGTAKTIIQPGKEQGSKSRKTAGDFSKIFELGSPIVNNVRTALVNDPLPLEVVKGLLGQVA